MTPQTTYYLAPGIERFLKFKQSQISNLKYNEKKSLKSVKSLKNLKSSNSRGQSASKKKQRGSSPVVHCKQNSKIANNFITKKL